MAASVKISAQLQPGSIAPDFTAKDLNGQSWHLYELLDQGKIVLLEISATWCAPCWAYHNSHAMHHFYEQHGPDGDKKAQVLFIEGDPKTNVNCLYGPSGCNDFTPGNWIADTPFPIINDDSIAKWYEIGYFPTIFVVCPNRKIYQVGQWNADDLWEEANTCPVAIGTNNAGIYNYFTGTALHEVCEVLKVKPAFSLINLGTAPLIQATLDLKWNNNIQQTIEWTGNLNLYEEAPVSFDEFPLIEAGNLTANLVRVNYATTDDDTANNTYLDKYSTASAFSSSKVLLKVRTDQYGAETYWELHDEAGSVLDSGGNKAVGPTGGGTFNGISGGPGAYGNNAIIRDTLDLPGPGCYSIHFVDYYGDGMCCNYGNGYFKLYNIDDPNSAILSGGSFRAYEDRAFSAGLITSSGEPEDPGMLFSLSLFPNPADQQLHLSLSLPETSPVSGWIANSLGTMAYRIPTATMQAGIQEQDISTTQLPNGFYWLYVQVEGKRIARKFVVQHRF